MPVKKFFSQFFYSVEKDFKDNILKVAIIISLLAIVYLLSENIFLSFVIAAGATVVLLGWDGRIFFGLGLIFLIFCPFLLAFDKKSLAEEMAVYAYYMLALGVLLQMVEYGKQSLKAHARSKRENATQTFTQRHLLFIAVFPAFIVFIFSAGAFYLVYSKMNQKLEQNTKLLTGLIEKQKYQKPKEETKEVSTETKQSEVPPVVVKQDPPMDWEHVQVFIENRAGTEGLEANIVDEFKQLGILNMSTSINTSTLMDSTTIEYCSTCLNISQELISRLQNPDKLLVVETPELDGEIVVRLGKDQYVPQEKDILISILNGSRFVGIAGTLRDQMLQKGFQVKHIGDALRKDYTKTVIKYSAGNSDKAEVVKNFLSGTYSEFEMQEDNTLQSDVEIILSQS